MNILLTIINYQDLESGYHELLLNYGALEDKTKNEEDTTDDSTKALYRLSIDSLKQFIEFISFMKHDITMHTDEEGYITFSMDTHNLNKED